MSKGMNLFVILLLIAGGIAFIISRVRSSKNSSIVSMPSDPFDMGEITSYIKVSLHELSRNHQEDYGMSEEAYQRKRNQRSELRQALKGCVLGDLNDKLLVKQYIADLLIEGYGLNEENIDQVIPFDESNRLTTQDRFEIILYLYKKNYEAHALKNLIQAYNWDEPKRIDNVEGGWRYEITSEEVDRAFYLEYRKLKFTEKLDIVVQRIYQMYKGFSVIDEIRDQSIDGVSGGVSGAPGDQHSVNDIVGGGMQSCDSVWIFYKGKSIRLSFLTFGSQGELKRVCQNIYKYNLPGQLSQASGYKVNEMKDGSRVVVVRPPFAESWAFFVRKFDSGSATLEQLIQGEGSEIAIRLLKFLMKGGRITAITGSQGSGKTTLLMALVSHIYEAYTLRVQEMSFELHLRKLYPTRNILTFRETEEISGQSGLDLQKKTDGSVHILGEVATDEVASWMIQTAQVASLFTLFTHHAKTFSNLIHSLRNSLLKAGAFHDERTAERQVVDVLDFDIHLKHDMSGNRYIERITECVSAEGDVGLFAPRDILIFRDGRYVIVDTLSPATQRAMKQEMTPDDADAFDQFIDAYWGERIGA